MGLFGFILMIFLIGAFAWYRGTHNKIVHAEKNVIKQMTDLERCRRSGQGLLNDFIVSISTYGKYERETMERYYSALDNMIRMGFGQSSLVAPTALPSSGLPTRLVDLYQVRMQELSRLEERFIQTSERYTAALAEYHSLRDEFPTSWIPEIFIGNAERVPLLGADSDSFIDIQQTCDLINDQLKKI